MSGSVLLTASYLGNRTLFHIFMSHVLLNVRYCGERRNRDRYIEFIPENGYTFSSARLLS